MRLLDLLLSAARLLRIRVIRVDIIAKSPEPQQSPDISPLDPRD